VTSKPIVVIKAGSKSLCGPKGGWRYKVIHSIVSQAVTLKALGYDVIVVASGAIYHAKQKYGNGMDAQTYASIGQPKLQQTWEKAFWRRHRLLVGQIQFADQQLRGRSRHTVVNGLLKALRDGITPIVNSNDAVSEEEIDALPVLSDNDVLASLLAINVQAEHLIMLTTVDGVLDPRTGELISEMRYTERKIESRLQEMPGESNGGMKSKVKHGKRAARAGIDVYIASAKCPNVIVNTVLRNPQIGTHIIPKTAGNRRC